MMRRIFTALIVLSVAAPLPAQTTIGITPTNHFPPLGKGTGSDVPTTVAQTFALPAGMNVLQSFSFLYTEAISGTDLRLDGSVYRYVAATQSLSATALYRSALFTASHDESNDVTVTFGSALHPLNLDLGGVPLGPGDMLAFVLSSINGATNPADGAQIALATDSFGDPSDLPGGLFYSFATTPAELSAPGSLSSLDDNPNAAFSATFTAGPVTATPEPASVVLIATGLAGLSGVAARRRRRSPR